jgi:hypothetical protein
MQIKKSVQNNKKYQTWLVNRESLEISSWLLNFSYISSNAKENKKWESISLHNYKTNTI